MIRHVMLAAAIAATSAIATASPARSENERSAAARVAAANRAALREPASSGYLNAVQIYPYTDGALYRVLAAPERVTDIALQAGEALVAVASGDTVRWTVGDTTSGTGDSRRTHLLVKPFAAGLRTNLVVTTDRRVYHLELESNAAPAMTAIAWTYPQDALLALRRARDAAAAATPVADRIAVERLNFNYEISGDRPTWRPTRAVDDGRQTYVEFPPDIAAGEVPPIFVIGPQGDAQLVNYRMVGRYFVVDRLFDAAELRLGARRQQIVRIERSRQAARREARR